MKEILKYYLTIRTSLLDNIFSKSEEEKKKILKNLIILYLAFILIPQIISIFSPIGQIIYGLSSSLTGIPVNILILKTIILNLLLIGIWAFLANYLLKVFGEKDGFLVFFIGVFYYSIFNFISFILKQLFPYIIGIINEGNIQVFAILFMIFASLSFILAIWGLILFLVLYINRLKGFWNFIKYILVYLFSAILIYLPIAFILGLALEFYIKLNITNKYLNSSNSTTLNSSNFYGSHNVPSLTTNSDNHYNDYFSSKNNYSSSNFSTKNNSGSLEEFSTETNSGKTEKIEENKVLENNYTFSEEDEKASKVRDSFRKIYLNSINKFIKSYFEKNSDYPEKLEEISEVENLKNKFKEKFGEFKSKNGCNFDISYEKNNGYTLKICLENDKDFELKN